MAKLTSIQFVDTTLSYDGPLALSCKHPNLKWLIREHLLSLLSNFPSLTPSTDTFTHDDGTTVNLLNISGPLPISLTMLPIPLTIWIHQSYPFVPPLVFLSSIPDTPIVGDHPFVDPSGAISCPYLQTWLYPHSNLLSLAHNLVHIFELHHPFSHTFSIFSNITNASLASKMEALNCLVIALHYDIRALRAKAEEDIEGLWSLQAELVDRGDIVIATLLGLEHERSTLKQRVMELTNKADVLINWLGVHDPKFAIGTSKDKSMDAFESVDEDSDRMIKCLEQDQAIEDLLYALENGVEKGVVPFNQYLKKVRTLSREQFFHRAMLVKLRNSDIFHGLD